ncbi:MAG: DnaA regulatory inactivator Hda [Pseudomonadota bacterium]
MMQQLAFNFHLNKFSRFEDFYGDSNKQLLAYLNTFIRPDNHERFIYLWGKPAVGKTHLLQACCHQSHHDGRRVFYLSFNKIDDFMPELLENVDAFSLICLDDVDLLNKVADKHRARDWEIAIFNLYNRLQDNNDSKLIVAAGKPARQLDFSLKDLTSRLQSGVVFEVKPLAETSKRDALKNYAQQHGFELPGKTIDFLLRHQKRDMQTLMQTLTRLEQASLSYQRRLTVPFVKEVLETWR